MTIADLVYIDENGYFYADYPTFLAWYQNEYRTIYGADIYLEADSQDGQWIAVQAKAAYDLAALGSSVVNSQSPVTAQGVPLARIVKINGISKQAATNSTADLAIVGTAGTVITNGVAIDTLDQKWDLPASVTIPGGGTITVTATAQVVGAVNAAATTINRIFTPTRGWQTVNNVAAATPGEPVESDAELRVRQQQSTANPSLTVFDGTVGGVQSISGVTSARGYENDTGSTDTNGIPAHKIALVVQGGDATEIAEMIALHKTPGTGTHGTTTEVVYDAHGMPLSIKFYRPTVITVEATITVSALQGWSSDYEDLIAQAVADTINAFGIGNDVIWTRMFPPAYLPGTAAGGTFEVVSITINAAGDPAGVVNVDIDFNELADCDYTTDITIAVT